MEVWNLDFLGIGPLFAEKYCNGDKLLWVFHDADQWLDGPSNFGLGL